MNDVQVLTQQEAGAMRRGTWRAAYVPPDRNTAYVCCPKCGAVGALPATHSIEVDGAVQPAIACLESGCDFHQHVLLAGWHA